jgi:hypothetical protein
MKPTFPGLVIHHDIRNENYLYTDTQPKLVAKRAAKAAEVPIRTVHHRQYRRYDQGNNPSCTGFGMVTYCAAAHEFNAPPISGEEWYAENVKRDQANGLFFDGGATVTAALETGRALGLWSVYRWIYDLPNLLRALQTRPVVAGTVWYDSMFQRDAEGIVSRPLKTQRTNAGHLYTIGAYDAARDLLDVEQTWAPYPGEVSMPYGGWVYRIPGELMARLIREEGEIAVPDEVKLPRRKAA